eukprot:TRINITY_DN33733_c0_g1_i1.p1 TRINITY_DN33733_c0_g1~~TRINITY_DN33733_c0_g1_i1.p1  ORF type:complete len:634 (+),score=121.79 TRINITY_DN33733_c0_g1_i1:74-1975(+)
MAKRKSRPQGVVVAAGASGGAASPSGGRGGSAAPASTSAVHRKKKRRRMTRTEQPSKDAGDEADSGEDAAGSDAEVAPSVETPAVTSAASAAMAPKVLPAPPVDADAPRCPWAACGGDQDMASTGPRNTTALEWLLWPLAPAEFFSNYWEKRPLLLRRGRSAYYRGLFSKADFDRSLRSGDTPIPYGERLNLVRYDTKTKQKLLLNKGDRGTLARPDDVNSAWDAGCSMQVLHPQHLHAPVWALLAQLETSFGALFGANAYLTPTSGRQGFAPHWDDVEVFFLQLEGAKRWRLYAPPEGEVIQLPRENSRDFKPEELGQVLLDCVLEQGDLLYMPRGTVYQGVVETASCESTYSHHLSVSTYQKTAWCDVLEKVLGGALERASAGDNEEFREGLPVGFLEYMGSWHDRDAGDEETVGAAGRGLIRKALDKDAAAAAADAAASTGERRAIFKRRVAGLLKRLQDFVDLDEVCDELGVDFMSRRLPPCGPGSAALTAPETSGSSAGSLTTTKPPLTVALDNLVRWADSSATRPVLGTDPETSEATVMLFHSLKNERSHHMSGGSNDPEEDVGCLRFEAAVFMPALRTLCTAYPNFVRCGDLPLSCEDDRIALCENLAAEGLLEVIDKSRLVARQK